LRRLLELGGQGAQLVQGGIAGAFPQGRGQRGLEVGHDFPNLCEIDEIAHGVLRVWSQWLRPSATWRARPRKRAERSTDGPAAATSASPTSPAVACGGGSTGGSPGGARLPSLQKAARARQPAVVPVPACSATVSRRRRLSSTGWRSQRSTPRNASA